MKYQTNESTMKHTPHECSYCGGEMRNQYASTCWDCYFKRFPKEFDVITLVKVKLLYPDQVATPKKPKE